MKIPDNGGLQRLVYNSSILYLFIYSSIYRPYDCWLNDFYHLCSYSSFIGGANIPALNDLLSPFGIVFGDRIYNGELEHEKERTIVFSSGQSLARFPKGGSLGRYNNVADQVDEIISEGGGGGGDNIPAATARNVNNNNKEGDSPAKVQSSTSNAQQSSKTNQVALLGLYPTLTKPSSSSNPPPAFPSYQDNEAIDLTSYLATSGRVAVFGDSTCLDDISKRPSCLWLLSNLLKWSTSDSRHTNNNNNNNNEATNWMEKLGNNVGLERVLEEEYVDQRVKLPGKPSVSIRPSKSIPSRHIYI